MSQSMCGQCLRLTNLWDTSHQLIVRVVDLCGHGLLDLDWTRTFSALDTADRHGWFYGHLNVTVESVPCYDPPESKRRLPARHLLE